MTIDGLFAAARLTYATLWGVDRADGAAVTFAEGRIVLRVPKRRIELSRAEIDELIASLTQARRLVGRSDVTMGEATTPPRPPPRRRS